MKPLFDHWYIFKKNGDRHNVPLSEIYIYADHGIRVFREDGIVGDILRWLTR